MAMAPPLSPRETRRSGRRSAPSVSTSNSKSPDSDPPQRPPSSTTGNSRNNKRLKQEDTDDVAPASTNATHNSNGRSKRKPKEKSRQPPSDDPPEVSDVVQEQSASVAPGDEEEEQGITRCVCGSTGEDDPDTGEFMVQCETCKVWQHGFCMGFESEDQLHDDDYYCELCRPELHPDIPKKIKKARQSSTNSHQTAAPTSSRLSRSHSPSYSTKQPSKRRNTMNSRVAAFDEDLKDLLDSSAAEAGTAPDMASTTPNGHPPVPLPETEESLETAPANRKKRKRADNDVTTSVKKRTRSMSTTSDQAPAAPIQQPPREETPNPAKPTPTPAPPNQKSTVKTKRGGRKSVAANQDTSALEGDGTPVPPTKRQGNGGRSKAANGSRRPPHSSAQAGAGSHDPNSRRGQANGSGAQNQGSNSAESRAHRNTHAYVVSQQPLFTSWGLPDYLAHLENMLPSQIPQPLEVVSSITGRGESIERTTERGVKVKWPSKRMSVVDMNKRVRALVEWVGREQASASDRARRREALEKALKENSALIRQSEVSGGSGRDVDSMTMDLAPPAQSNATETPAFSSGSETVSLMNDMEGLMTDLISFQERFGPGSKTRERRHAS
ncbi:Histone deacetylase complex subunit [Paramarasmius palmivorus]|uniref:Histone deacetylase complex subunit n=1 Tax=Paramarasmius palmivorus TaxID=297713 RepID=A0AAW0DLG1_9AGAR